MRRRRSLARPLHHSAVAVGFAVAFVVGCGAPRRAPAASAPAKSSLSAGSSVLVSDDLRRARALDEQGVLAFEAGHYHDAILYFTAAFEHGGPASERWNVAKCLLRLDETEQAEAELVAYLGLPGLTPEDRRDGTAALEALRRRSSTLTITSTPLGLTARVDGRRVGTTPLSLQLSPGEHVVAVERDPSTRDARRVAAHLGRAVLVEAHP